MAAKMVSLRIDEELLAWATAYAEKRGVSRTLLLENALVSFREDCERGVPELRAQIGRQTAPPPAVRPTREYFNAATADRAELFSKLSQPKSITAWKGAGRDDS